MAEWLGENTDGVASDIKELSERLKKENQKAVEDTIDYLKGDNGETE